MSSVSDRQRFRQCVCHGGRQKSVCWLGTFMNPLTKMRYLDKNYLLPLLPAPGHPDLYPPHNREGSSVCAGCSSFLLANSPGIDLNSLRVIEGDRNVLLRPCLDGDYWGMDALIGTATAPLTSSGGGRYDSGTYSRRTSQTGHEYYDDMPGSGGSGEVKQSMSCMQLQLPDGSIVPAAQMLSSHPSLELLQDSAANAQQQYYVHGISSEEHHLKSDPDSSTVPLAAAAAVAAIPRDASDTKPESAHHNGYAHLPSGAMSGATPTVLNNAAALAADAGSTPGQPAHPPAMAAAALLLLASNNGREQRSHSHSSGGGQTSGLGVQALQQQPVSLLVKRKASSPDAAVNSTQSSEGYDDDDEYDYEDGLADGGASGHGGIAPLGDDNSSQLRRSGRAPVKAARFSDGEEMMDLQFNELPSNGGSGALSRGREQRSASGRPPKSPPAKAPQRARTQQQQAARSAAAAMVTAAVKSGLAPPATLPTLTAKAGGTYSFAAPSAAAAGVPQAPARPLPPATAAPGVVAAASAAARIGARLTAIMGGLMASKSALQSSERLALAMQLNRAIGAAMRLGGCCTAASGGVPVGAAKSPAEEVVAHVSAAMQSLLQMAAVAGEAPEGVRLVGELSSVLEDVMQAS